MPSNTRHSMVRRPLTTFETRTFKQYISSLKPYLWYQFNENSDDTVVVNYGLGGTTYNGNLTKGLGGLGQIGQFGLNSACLFDGADTRINIANGSAYANAPDITVIALINPTDAGESNTGSIYTFDNNNNRLLYGSDFRYFIFRRITSATNPNTVTNAFQVPINGVWQLMIATYNDTERKCHLYNGYNGDLTEYTYLTQTVGTGTLSNETNSLNIGNNSVSSFTWNGLIGHFIWINEFLTDDKLLALIKLAKV